MTFGYRYLSGVKSPLLYSLEHASFAITNICVLQYLGILGNSYVLLPSIN